MTQIAGGISWLIVSTVTWLFALFLLVMPFTKWGSMAIEIRGNGQTAKGKTSQDLTTSIATTLLLTASVFVPWAWLGLIVVVLHIFLQYYFTSQLHDPATESFIGKLIRNYANDIAMTMTISFGVYLMVLLMGGRALVVEIWIYFSGLGITSDDFVNNLWADFSLGFREHPTVVLLTAALVVILLLFQRENERESGRAAGWAAVIMYLLGSLALWCIASGNPWLIVLGIGAFAFIWFLYSLALPQTRAEWMDLIAENVIVFTMFMGICLFTSELMTIDTFRLYGRNLFDAAWPMFTGMFI